VTSYHWERHFRIPSLIFNVDDVACDKQDAIREYFSMGRHADVDCFYLCQTYAKISKHLIRNNANLLILFKQNGINLKHVYNDHVNRHVLQGFLRIIGNCWQQKYWFLVIDKDSAPMGDIEKKNLMTLRTKTWSVVNDTSTHQHRWGD